MGIITRPRANPAMLRAVARYCRYREIDEISAEDLRAVIAPDAYGGGAAGSVWHDSFNLAQELGFLAPRDDLVAVDPTLRDRLAEESRDGFRRALRSLVL